MKRYIDAEAAEAVVRKLISSDCSPFDKQDAIDDMKSIPTADVQEVKHGKWIQDHGWYSHHCSNCGRSTSNYVREDGDLYDRVFDFCPNCGARMDGDEK